MISHYLKKANDEKSKESIEMGKGEYLDNYLLAHYASSAFVIYVICMAIHSGSLQYNKMGRWIKGFNFGSTSARLTLTD